jgi:DNA invertase Pin-like site-specific DNA recombinase
MPKAFSYLRFSTPEQLRGDSLRRQLDLAERYAAANHLDLDRRSFEDLGVSAFRSKNAQDGTLGEFLRLVRSGDIPKGSFLLVESLDRLSRAKVRRAMRLLEDICDEGIVVVTLADNRRYDAQTLDDDPMSLMFALVVAMRAHEESAMKSRRLRAAWSAKRGRGRERPLTARVPAWLELDKDRRKFHVIEDRAAVVRRIYDLTLEGVGQHTITTVLNRERVRTFGRGRLWQRSYVAKILGNPAVVGTYVPHTLEHEGGKRVRRPTEPIEGYYPRVVKRDVYERVQAQRMGSRAPRGSSQVQNLLAGLAKCPLCCATMTRVTKGEGNGRPYLVCTTAKYGGGCKYRVVRLAPIEDAIRANIGILAKDVPTTRSVLSDELAAIEGQIACLKAEIARVVDEIATKGSSPALSAGRLARETLLDKAENERAEIAAKLAVADGPYLSQRLRELLCAFRAGEFNRSQANSILRQLFRAVTIVPDQGVLAFHWNHHNGETLMPFEASQ